MLLGFENEQKDFSLDEFKQRYRAQTIRTSFYEYLDEQTQDLMKTGRVGYANSHKDLKRILTRYREKDFIFSDVDYAFLRKVEQFFRERGLLENAMGVYFRTFRAVYNKAVADGHVKKGDSPFDDFKVSKFKVPTKSGLLQKKLFNSWPKLKLHPGFDCMTAVMPFCLASTAQASTL